MCGGPTVQAGAQLRNGLFPPPPIACLEANSISRCAAHSIQPPAPPTPPTQRQPHVGETKPTKPTGPDADTAGARALPHTVPGAGGGSAAWATALKLAVALVAVCAITENVASTAYGTYT